MSLLSVKFLKKIIRSALVGFLNDSGTVKGSYGQSSLKPLIMVSPFTLIIWLRIILTLPMTVSSKKLYFSLSLNFKLLKSYLISMFLHSSANFLSFSLIGYGFYDPRYDFFANLWLIWSWMQLWALKQILDNEKRASKKLIFYKDVIFIIIIYKGIWIYLSCFVFH